MPTLNIKRLDQNAVLPRYESEEAAGMDLSALELTTLAPGAWGLVRTGIAMEIPSGHEGQVRPRSGLAVRHGVTVLNAPGTIDADYRGEVKVALINHGDSAYTIQPGDRIAQLVIAPVTRVSCEEVDGLERTARGQGGFGSTGT